MKLMLTAKKLATAFVVLAAMAVSPASQAQTCDGCVTAAVQSAAQTIKSAVNDASDAITSAIEGSTKALIKAHGRIADSQAKIGTAGMRAQKMADISEKFQPASAAYQTAGVADVAHQASTDTAAQENIYAGTLLERKLNPDLGYSERVRAIQDATKKYAQGGSMPNADVSVDSLLSGAGTNGKTKSLTFTNDQIEAAGRYIMNAISAGTPAPLPTKYLNTDDGQRYEMMRREVIAQVSLAQKIHADALTYRTGIPSLGGASMQDFISAQINGRYGNKGWLVGLEKRGQAALTKDGLYMNALQLKLMQMQLDHLEKIELALGQILDRSSGSTEKMKALENMRTRAMSAVK